MMCVGGWNNIKQYISWKKTKYQVELLVCFALISNCVFSKKKNVYDIKCFVVVWKTLCDMKCSAMIWKTLFMHETHILRVE